MDRRSFFSAARNHQSTVATSRTQSGVGQFTGAFTRNHLHHLLRRSLFGVKPAWFQDYAGLSVTDAVDKLLNPTYIPALPVKEYTTSTTPGVNADANIAQGTTWVNDVNNDGAVQAQRRASYKKWMVGNLVLQDASIQEKLITFWIDHFGNETADVGFGNWAYNQHQAIRQHAMGNLRSMLMAMSKDVMMLRYLNGYLNNKSAPDENYARELFELFTLGKGPGSQYTEADVKAAARLLTGWQINTTNYTAVFNLARHDTGNKQFSGFFNNKLIVGRNTAQAGDQELAELIDMILATTETAKFICRKLYRFFVYYEIDAQVERDVIEPLANLYRASNYEIKPVLKALLSSEHFYDAANMGCYIKTPADLIIGSLHDLNAVFPPVSNYDANYVFYNNLYAVMTALGQDLHDPPNVSGLPAFYQEPLFHEVWINSDSLPKRNAFTDLMVYTGYTRSGIRLQFDLLTYVKTTTNPGNPTDLINEIVDRLYRVPLSVESKQQIKSQILLSNQQWDYYWTNAWLAYMSTPNTANTTVVTTRLKELFHYLMALAEYQLA